jgi:hypothetical protein
MAIALLGLIVASGAIGIQAQVTKGRTGTGWGFITFVVLFIIFITMWPDHTMMPTDTQPPATSTPALDSLGPAGFAAAAAIMLGAPVMAIIVASLPKLK